MRWKNGRCFFKAFKEKISMKRFRKTMARGYRREEVDAF